MSETESDPEDPITKEEITEAAAAPEPSSVEVSRGTKRNAFEVLMAPKPKRQPEPEPEPEPPILTSIWARSTGSSQWRDSLRAYTDNPTSFPAGRVIYHNASFVIIKDRYPKSSVHTLLLPRSPRSRMHPIDAFEDAEFLASVRAEATRLKRLAGKELQRLYGRFSAQDKQREAVLNMDVEWDVEAPLPVGRDWEKEILVGVHAHPSMHDLHVHVLSRDMVSDCMRNRKHYQSFNTPFLIDIAEFPLPANDVRRNLERGAGFIDEDMGCWRCKRNFGNQFKRLKEHLAEEFEVWKKK
ncbi:HIT domain-containing protein [Xylaria scruposa]|nr:HIT domain-containing protein [Xylaria scruposa]